MTFVGNLGIGATPVIRMAKTAVGVQTAWLRRLVEAVAHGSNGC